MYGKRRISYLDSMILRRISQYIDSRVRRVFDIANGKPDYYPGGRWPEGYDPKFTKPGPYDEEYRAQQFTAPNSLLVQVRKIDGDVYKLLSEIRSFRNMDQKPIFELLAKSRMVFDYINKILGSSDVVDGQLSPQQRKRQIADLITKMIERYQRFKKENLFDESVNFLSLEDRRKGKAIINAAIDKMNFLAQAANRMIR